MATPIRLSTTTFPAPSSARPARNCSMAARWFASLAKTLASTA